MYILCFQMVHSRQWRVRTNSIHRIGLNVGELRGKVPVFHLCSTCWYMFCFWAILRSCSHTSWQIMQNVPKMSWTFWLSKSWCKAPNAPRNDFRSISKILKFRATTARAFTGGTCVWGRHPQPSEAHRWHQGAEGHHVMHLGRTSWVTGFGWT